MAHAVDEDDRDDDESDDDDGSIDEDPLASDQDADEAYDPEETVPCPFCRKPIHEDADVCRHCHNYVGSSYAPRRVPLFIWIGVIFAGLCVLVWLLI